MVHLAILALGFSIGQRPLKGLEETYCDNLSHWREQFEDVLEGVPQGHGIGFGYIQSEMNGAWGEGLYPINSASERFIFYTGDDGHLMYQKRRGNVAVQVWDIHLAPLKGHRKLKGTLLKYLASCGCEIPPHAHLTAAMRRQLSSNGYFAWYTRHPEAGNNAAVLRPDGTLTPPEHVNPRWPPDPPITPSLRITQAERKLLQPAMNASIK